MAYGSFDHIDIIMIRKINGFTIFEYQQGKIWRVAMYVRRYKAIFSLKIRVLIMDTQIWPRDHRFNKLSHYTNTLFYSNGISIHVYN